MIRFRIVLVYWVVAVCFFMPQAAYAYIDPATTTYLIQIITAVVVMLGVSLSIFMYRFKMISAKVRYGLYRVFRRRGGNLPSAVEEYDIAYYVFPEYAVAGAPNPPTAEDMTLLGEPSDMAVKETGNSAADNPGQYSYSGRLKTALPVVLSVCLSFILIGCIDLAVQNETNLPFMVSEAVPVIALCFAVCFVLLLVIIPLFRGSIFEILISLALGFLISGYIQGNFLNMGLGELTGDQIIWSIFLDKMVISSIIWVCIFVAVFVLRRFKKRLWRRFTIFVPILLIIVQGVALLSLSSSDSQEQGGAFGIDWATLKETLSIEGIGELSSDKNTVFIILDRLDEEFITEIKEIDPAFFEPLDGFTQFEDNISYYVSTFPSVTAMLTGNRFFFDGPVTPYFDYAWENAKYLQELKAHGVDIRLYMDRGHVYNHIEQLQGIASNILVPEYGFNSRIALVKFLKLSAFRYAPMPAKQAFWLSPTEFSDAINLASRSAPYITNDLAFYERLVTEGLEKKDGSPTFFFVHLLGAHDPILMDENIQPNRDSTPLRQAIGAFKIVYEFIDRMKELGLYEDATIIITGDHGHLHGDGVNRPALTGLFVKPPGSFGTPLAISGAPVCPDYLGATILEGMLGDSGDFGPTYFDVKEGDDVRREYITNLKYYEIIGDGRVFDNWHLLGTLENKSDW